MFAACCGCCYRHTLTDPVVVCVGVVVVVCVGVVVVVVVLVVV
jgi:hypothetical protein